METNLHGDEMDNVELDPEKERTLNRGLRKRKVNTKDRESAEAEEIYHARCSLGSYLARVSTVINQVKTSITEARECEEVREVVKNLEHAWARYSDTYQSYILKNLPVEEFERVEQHYSKIYDDYSRCVKTVEDYLRPCSPHSSKGGLKSSNREPKLSLITSTKSESSRSSKSSKRKEMKKSVELKKLIAEQAAELARYEAEMEKKKIDIEMQKANMAREIRFKAQLAEKEYDLLSLADGDSASNEENSVVKNEVDHTFPLEPQLPKQEQTANWITSCHNETTKMPLNPKADEFIPCSGTNSTQAILLRVTTLQAMQPVKFSGNAADFPVFRRRIRDNLEDGLLSNAQKIEFLPKFVSGEAYDVVARSAGCSYEDIVANLEDRYGQPATVAAAYIEKLTVGPKLGNRDFNGLRNFAEQLQCATKRLEGDYEREASTTANMKLIAGRLPDYLINKWADVSYSIREKGLIPALKDLAKFVKRQAAIKNDPGFAGVVAIPTTETRGNRKKPPHRTNDPPNPRRTSSFVTDFDRKDTRRRGTGEGQSKLPCDTQNCLCCSGSHELASCPELKGKDLQTHWGIVKRHRLCHVCMRQGHHRERCESQRFCPCGSEKRHHRLLHNPPRRDTAETNRSNQIPQGDSKPAVNGWSNGEQRNTTEPRSTVQYATVTEPTKKKTVLLHVIPVKVLLSDGKSITTYGLLDNGSRGTMIGSEVAKELDLKGQKEIVSVSTLLQQEDERV